MRLLNKCLSKRIVTLVSVYAGLAGLLLALGHRQLLGQSPHDSSYSKDCASEFSSGYLWGLSSGNHSDERGGGETLFGRWRYSSGGSVATSCHFIAWFIGSMRRTTIPS
jgi:hypothetical protein